MLLPYLVRLLCLCLAAFFLTHSAGVLLASMLAPAVSRMASNARAGTAAKITFALKMSPLAIATAAVLLLCVPSYLWLEPRRAAETVGYDCLAVALLGAAVIGLSLLRGTLSIWRTRRYVTECLESGSRVHLDSLDGVLLSRSTSAVMGVAGVVHPKLIVSESVMNGLTLEEQETALSHEAAHLASRDNLKRLLLRMAPDALPFIPALKSVERQWAKYSEWAADDVAVNGSSESALLLATALVRVAQLGSVQQSSYVLSSLVGDDEDLRVRVDRLLREQQYVEKPLAPLAAIGRKLAAGCACLLGLAMIWPGSLGSVHVVLEKLIR